MMLLPDPLPHLVAVARAGGEPGQPDALFAALDIAMGAVIGHKLFILLVYHADTAQSDRLRTVLTRTEPYPIVALTPLPNLSPRALLVKAALTMGRRRLYMGQRRPHRWWLLAVLPLLALGAALAALAGGALS